MARYRCSVCGYVYDEQRAGRPWRELPEGWSCPQCGAPKSAFTALEPTTGAAVAASGGRLLLAHRAFGYVFAAFYAYFLWQMAPRLWSYQVEFAPRTTIHIALGMAIGPALLLKILVARFFKPLGASLAPALGVFLFVASFVLIGLSAPFAFQQAWLERAAGGGGAFGAENAARVRQQLLQLNAPSSRMNELASAGGLRAGRRLLLSRCVGCHDLRTVLARPRTPADWRRTVARMAERTTMLDPLDEGAQWRITAYLIAITPQLQKSVQQQREAQRRREESRRAAEQASAAEVEEAAFNMDAAASLFETKCGQCHPARLAESAPPESRRAAEQLVANMVEQGLEGTVDELSTIAEYLARRFATKDVE